MLTGSTMLSMDPLPSKTYSVTVDNVPSDDVIADSSWLASSKSDYAKSERVYAAFVRDKYLDLPEEERDAVNTYLFSSDSWDAGANVSDTAVISRVRTMLASLAGQTDNPPTYTGATSFVAWFLGTAHEGNSAYFATAATLAFRSQGISARYVEGYQAADDQLAAAVGAGVALNLTAADAHAWTEIYLDGQGWTPVEVTPGYYSQTLDADKIIDVGEAWSNGVNDKTLDAGSVAGQAEDKHREDVPAMHNIPVVAKVGVGLIGAVIAVLLALFIRRFVLRVRRKRAIESDEQNICVPALYGYLALVMNQSGLDAFDETKPLDCLDAFAAVSPRLTRGNTVERFDFIKLMRLVAASLNRTSCARSDVLPNACIGACRLRKLLLNASAATCCTRCRGSRSTCFLNILNIWLRTRTRRRPN